MAEWETGEPAGWLDEDEVASEDEVAEFEIPPLDVSAIRSVRYTSACLASS